MTVDVVTPALVVDLDRLESNLARWQEHCDRTGLANRPHVKTHKSVEIALRQVELGARGVTCQTLHEAEVMVDAGIDDVLLPYNVVGERKLERLASLVGRASVRVTADDPGLLNAGGSSVGGEAQGDSAGDERAPRSPGLRPSSYGLGMQEAVPFVAGSVREQTER